MSVNARVIEFSKTGLINNSESPDTGHGNWSMILISLNNKIPESETEVKAKRSEI